MRFHVFSYQGVAPNVVSLRNHVMCHPEPKKNVWKFHWTHLHMRWNDSSDHGTSVRQRVMKTSPSSHQRKQLGDSWVMISTAIQPEMKSVKILVSKDAIQLFFWRISKGDQAVRSDGYITWNYLDIQGTSHKNPQVSRETCCCLQIPCCPLIQMTDLHTGETNKK